MTPKKALCIHSFTTIGRSSTAVIAPALAAKGIQPVMLPTVVLSETSSSTDRVIPSRVLMHH